MPCSCGNSLGLSAGCGPLLLHPPPVSRPEFGGAVVCGLGGPLSFGGIPGQPEWADCFQDARLLLFPQCGCWPLDGGRAAVVPEPPGCCAGPPLPCPGRHPAPPRSLSGSPQCEAGGTGALLPGEPPSPDLPPWTGALCCLLLGELTEDLVAGTALGTPPLWECRQLTLVSLRRCVHKVSSTDANTPIRPSQVPRSQWACSGACAGAAARQPGASAPLSLLPSTGSVPPSGPVCLS